MTPSRPYGTPPPQTEEESRARCFSAPLLAEELAAQRSEGAKAVQSSFRDTPEFICDSALDTGLCRCDGRAFHRRPIP